MKLTRLVIRTLAVIVTIVGLTIAVSAIPTSSPRDRAAAWAKSLSAAERQMYTSPEQLAGLPVEYRKAIFATFSTAHERAAFWKSVFAAYRRNHILSPSQNSTLKRAEAMIPVMFSVPAAQRVTQEAALARVSEEVKRVLGPEAQRELFLTAGPDGRTSSLPIGERVMLHAAKWSKTNLAGRAVARIAPSVGAAGGCNCNASQDDCTYSMHCTAGLNGCEQQGGCACEWIIFNCWTCDGICNYAQAEG